MKKMNLTPVFKVPEYAAAPFIRGPHLLRGLTSRKEAGPSPKNQKRLEKFPGDYYNKCYKDGDFAVFSHIREDLTEEETP